MSKGLERLMKARGLSEQDLRAIIKQAGNTLPAKRKARSIPYDSKRAKFVVVSDLHMGHKRYRPDILEHAIKMGRRHGADFFCIPGDILEGMSGREGHIYELSHIGATNQLAYAEEQLGQIDVPMFGITATNSHDGWYHSKNNAGLDIGPELERRVKGFTFLGYNEEDLRLDNGLVIRLSHPGDGVAYAISYKMQKYINSLSGGQKPDILLQGHYHKANYMFYRNIHGFDAGTLCEQTIFMKKKQTPAHLGYWIIDASVNKRQGGVDTLTSTFVPFYED